MPIQIINADGTLGGTDGTVVDANNRLPVAQLNTSYDCFLRAFDGSTPQYSTDATFNLPVGIEVSVDGGTTWYGNADNPSDLGVIFDVNRAALYRQPTLAIVGEGESLNLDGTVTRNITLASGTVLSYQPPVIGEPALVATDAGNGVVTLTGPTATGDITAWEWTNDNWSTTHPVASTSGTFPSTNTPALVLGGTYTFKVRARNVEAVSSDKTSSALTLVWWSDDFEDGSLDTAKWHTDILAPGSFVESGGKLSFANTADLNGKIVLQTKGALLKNVNAKLVVNGLITTQLGVGHGYLQVGGDTVYPATVDSDLWSSIMASLSFITQDTGNEAERMYAISTWNELGTRYHWNGSTWVEGAPGWIYDTRIAPGATYSAEFETTTSSQWRIKVTVGGVVLTTSSWRTFSATRAGNNPRVYWSDQSTTTRSDHELTSVTYAAV